jgi:hypothetical protein
MIIKLQIAFYRREIAAFRRFSLLNPLRNR